MINRAVSLLNVNDPPLVHSLSQMYPIHMFPPDLLPNNDNQIQLS
jgi:hypothetical protein